MTTMLFSERLSFKFISILLRVQKTVLLPYLIAGVAVVLATVVRVMLSERLTGAGPFITYYPAGVIAALVGFWPGVWATVISAGLSWYLFIPPAFVWSVDQREALSLLLFIFNCGVIVTTVTLLKLAVEQILEHEQSQRRLLEREKMLHQELRHRTRNFLAMIIAIINRSLTKGRSVAEAREVLTGRVHAIAEANAMMAEAEWSGIPLREILVREFQWLPTQPSVAGCEIDLNARAAQEFALLVHELATNSVKYGALSVEDGRVSIEGKINRSSGEEIFCFAWREANGPPIPSPPTSKSLL